MPILLTNREASLMKGMDFIDQVRKRYRKENGNTASNRQIARHLGISVNALQTWQARKTVTARQVAGLLKRVEARVAGTAIQPIVEFFELDAVRRAAGSRYEIFPVKDASGRDHPYRRGLRDELRKHHGIYIFHDSRGRALYVGKARTQSLWSEIKSAFNRKREVQKIRRVGHPERRQAFKTSDEKRRQISLRDVPLLELAAYMSAYRVDDGMIDELESMLIRGFPNDLLNSRMENFTFK
jgi:hypothetical protein